MSIADRQNEYEYLAEFASIDASGVSVRHAYSTHGAIIPPPLGQVALSNLLIHDTFTGADGTALSGRAPDTVQPGTAVWATPSAFTLLSNELDGPGPSASEARARIDVGQAPVEIQCRMRLIDKTTIGSAGLVIRHVNTTNYYAAEVFSASAISHQLRILKVESGVASCVASQRFTSAELDVEAMFTLVLRDTGTQLIASILENLNIFVSEDTTDYASATEIGILAGITGATSDARFDDFKAANTENNKMRANQRLLRPIAASASLSLDSYLSGIAQLSVGSAVLDNSDGGLDYLVGHSFKGGKIVVRRAPRGSVYSAFKTLFTGTIDTPIFTAKTVELRLRRPDALLDLPLSQAPFAGTGGREGGSDLKGKYKPLTIGRIKNVPMAMVDPSNGSGNPEYWASSYSPNTAAIYFAGVSKTVFVDWVSRSSSSGQYIELLTVPAGQVTGDFKPSASALIGDVLQRVLLDFCGYTEQQLDVDSFDQLSTDYPYEVGLYIGFDGAVRRDAINTLLRSVNAYLYTNRTGKIAAKVVAAPAVTPDHTLGDDVIYNIESLAKPTALKQVTVDYQRNYQVQTETDVAGSVTNARKQFLAEPHRRVIAEDASVLIREPLAETAHVVTALDAEADAQALVDDLLALHSPDRMVYNIDVRHNNYDIELGDTVEVTWPRFGMDSGVNFLVIGIRESENTGAYTLTVWG